MLNTDYVFEKMGKSLSDKLRSKNKDAAGDNVIKNISFKLNQMMSTDDRKGIQVFLQHILVTNGVRLEKGLTAGIIDSNELELSKNVGKFLEGLYKNFKSREE